MAEFLSYQKALDGVVDTDDIEPLVSLLEQHKNWGAFKCRVPSYRARLRALAGDEAFPESVRAAARRLTPRVTQAFALPFPEDPLDDAGVIVRSCLTEDTGPNRPGIEEATL